MSTSSESTGLRPRLNVETKVSGYDILNSALVSAIALFGFLTAILFLIWLTSIVRFDRKAPPLVTPQPWGDEKPEGYADDVLEPGVEEFPEIAEPALKDALEAVTDAISTVRANTEKVHGDAQFMGAGRGLGSIDGGDGTGGADVVPEYARWKIQYQTNDIGSYAAQLSFFGIDIGAVSIDANDIIRVTDPGGALRTVMSSRSQENAARSLYFVHEKNRLRQWDHQLAQQAGVDMSGRYTVQFIPEATRQLIREAEAKYLAELGKDPTVVRKTFFRVVPGGDGYQFEVTKIVTRRRGT